MPARFQFGHVKLALPKGNLLPATASLLAEIGLGFEGYSGDNRNYRLQSTTFSDLSAKVFQEKDIPIQVAVGNYDLGICGLDWIEELLAKYPASNLVKVTNLEYGRGNLYVVTSQYGGVSNLQQLVASQNSWRIASEYPNLAEKFALNLRLRRFRIFPLWGAAEVYPPESADLVVLWERDKAELAAQGLLPLTTLLSSSAFLIANKRSWETNNVRQIAASFERRLKQKPLSVTEPKIEEIYQGSVPRWGTDSVRLALPDGHQQLPTSEFLSKTEIRLEGYSGKVQNRRPTFNSDWICAKVIRPQDMPLQVANGNFDLAITGRDWLLDHLYRFPSSPVMELADLGFGAVRVVAVTSEELPVSSLSDLKQLINDGELSPLRVASEYVNIADKYLWDNHVSPYKLIPTWGASEAFLPEDADLLIENTQTGETLARHKLKIIDTLLRSTACLIGSRHRSAPPIKEKRIAHLVNIFRRAAEDS